MELRVLHAIAHGQTWYGSWGYAFGRGTLGISLKQWQAAVARMHRVKLAALWPHAFELAHGHSPLAAVLRRYTSMHVRLSPAQPCKPCAAKLHSMVINVPAC